MSKNIKIIFKKNNDLIIQYIYISFIFKTTLFINFLLFIKLLFTFIIIIFYYYYLYDNLNFFCFI